MNSTTAHPKFQITREALQKLLDAAGGKARVEDIYPASPVQCGMIYHSRLDPDSTVYVASMGWRLVGPFDQAAFEAAWDCLVARHTIFRTAFLGDELERPMQVVVRDAKLEISYVDYTKLAPEAKEHEFSDLQWRERNRGFDFAVPPIMRLAIVKFDERDHRIIWTVHHALLDGWSVPLVLNELAEVWQAVSTGGEPALGSPAPFRDYIRWIESQDLVAAEAYWRSRLADLKPPSAKLLAGRPGRTTAASADAKQLAGDFGSVDFSLDVTAELIATFARDMRVTQSAVAAAIWALLLGLHSEDGDACFGLVVSGRPDELPGVESRIGMFINTLPLRVTLDKRSTFRSFLKGVQQQQIDIASYQFTSPIQVRSWSGLSANSELFNSILVFDNYPRTIFENDPSADIDLVLEKINSFEQTSYPLTISVRTRHGMELNFSYDQKIYDADDIEVIAHRFKALLRNAVANPDADLKDISWLDEAQTEALLAAGRGHRTRPQQKSEILSRIGRIVADQPESIAIRAHHRTITYHELDVLSSALASGLLAQGVQRGSTVAVMLGVSSEQVLVMMALWKIGAVFVPIDRNAPEVRRDAILRQAAPSLAIVNSPDQGLQEALRALGSRSIGYGEIDLNCHGPLEFEHDALDIAYVLFTSGTTGQPKGVMISHGALTNFLAAMEQSLELEQPPHAAWLTAPTFDISLLEILLPLITGGTVTVFAGGTLDGAASLAQAVRDGKVDFIQATPSGWHMLLSAGVRLDGITALCGGEAVPASLAQTLAKEARAAWHVYGPTETTIWSSAHLIEDPNDLSVGAPLLNTDLLVLDAFGRLADIGVAGELMIGGAGLAQGYLACPRQTAQAFVPHPFEAGQRIYRTGDRAVRTANGQIKFLGRLDGQLKLRGQRIESGDIEAALIAAGAMQAKVRMVDSGGGEGLLAAWVTPATLDVQTLLVALRRHLPAALIPAHVIPIAAFPLNSSGKIDLAQLVIPAQDQHTVVEPATELEMQIKLIWQDVLKQDVVSVAQDFYSLGGHSLQAARIAAQLSDQLGRSVLIRDVLENPTIRKLGAVLSAVELPVNSAGSDDHLSQQSAGGLAMQDDFPFVPLAQQFTLQAEASPRRAAVICGSEKITYRELEERTNRLAHYLIAQGAGPEKIVAVQIERSAAMLITMVAIAKSGAAFLPIDPNYPAERQAYLVNDAQAALTVTRDVFDGLKLDGFPATPPQQPIHPAMLAYVIYTSGSTGQPKGAMVTQCNAANLYKWYAQRYEIEEGRRVLVVTSYSFDLTLKNLLAPLLYGGTVVLAPPGIVDGAALYDLVERHRIELVNCTPSQFYPMLEFRAELPMGLEFAILGGEPIRNEVLPPLGDKNAGCTYINSYGPTECTDVAIDGEITQPGQADYEISLGHPIDNMQGWVLDANLNPVADGDLGELYLRGAGVGRGYLSRPGLTAERYIPDPGGTGQRLYRTGDMVRRGTDGSFYFAGRTDHQVKIRGHRVELGEVEAALERHPDIARAVAVTDGVKLGVHYIAECEIPAAKLAAYLSEIVPSHMVPQAFAHQTQFPLTPSGKLDRAALAMPAIERIARGSRPLGAVEAVVAAAFAEQLGISDIQPDDNFFKLGGHSLLAMRVVAALREQLNIEIPLQLLFDEPSLGGFAARLEAAGAVPAALPAQPDVDRNVVMAARAYPLSFAQERMLFLELFGTAGSAYNVPIVARLLGRLEVEVLVAALDALIDRHEILRTKFVTTENGPVQEIVEPWKSGLAVETVSRDDLESEAANTMKVRLDIAAGRPLHARLLRIAEDEHVLLLIIHHIATDAWSNDLMIADLGRLYGAFAGWAPSMPPRPAGRYVDWANRQRNALTPQRLNALVDWWRRQLAGAPARMALPLDRPRPPSPSYRGARIPVSLSAATAQSIEAMAKQAGATPFMAYLALFALQLSRWTAESDLVIGTPIANRDHRDIQDVVGLFLNTLAIRINAQSIGSFGEMLEQTRLSALDAYSHMELPFEKLVEHLRPERDSSVHPIFQTMYVMQHQPAPGTDRAKADLTIAPLSLGSTTAKFDFSLLLTRNDAGITGSVEYATDLFDHDNVARFVHDFSSLADRIAQQPISAAVPELDAGRPVSGSGVLVKLSGNAAGVPIYCFPPAGGTAAGYIPLALQLADGPPLYGFDAQALAGDPAGMPMSVEALADIYLPELERNQPDGPISLLGYSVGGAIAFELARRLAQKGRNIASVILVDCYIQHDWVLDGKPLDQVAWEVCAAVYLRTGGAGDRFVAELPHHTDHAARRQLMHDALKAAGVHVAAAEDIERVFVTTRALVHAARTWVPKYYDGALNLVLATKSRAKPINQCLDDWAKVARQIDYKTIEASHIQLLDREYVPLLAEIVLAAINSPMPAGGKLPEDELCIGDA